MSRKRRALRPDEAELWKQVAETAIPLHPKKSDTKIVLQSKPSAQPPRIDKDFRVGQAARSTPRDDLKPALADQFQVRNVQMDRKSFERMKRGKLAPDARIDLHGMTQAQAHPALTQFILGAHASGARLVLVITGKGRPSDQGGPIPTPRGVLRHQVPEWLRQGALRQVVMQVSPAHIRHGGDGAYYVYLRRHR